MERLMGSEFVEWLYNRGKDLVVMIWTVALGVISPLKATIGLLILFFIVNCIFGYKAGFKCGEKFNMKKLKLQEIEVTKIDSSKQYSLFN